ncbi:MAG: hypothetical protein L7S64_03825 [Longimicrobiales bacterium]|nr:hypothetical protein [Longimicrobiales bacterium]
MTDETYPEIEALVATLRDRRLRLSAEGSRQGLGGGWCRIRFTVRGGQTLSVPIDDECEDAAEANAPLLLHPILSICEAYDESHDVLAWARDAELDASEDWVRHLYGELGDVVPKIRAVVGRKVRALTPWDYSMNMGVTRALRSLEYESDT